MAQQLLLDILPPSSPSLDNMVVGENLALVSATRELLPGQAIYVWGAEGCGRSHLLQACALQFGGHYVATGPNQGAALFELAECQSEPLSCVAIDDVHRMDASALSGVFRLYNRWRECASSEQAFRLMVSGDRAPLQLPIREDVRTRLGWGQIYRLMPLSDDEKQQALRSYAQSRAMPLSEDVLRWLLTHGSRDIRTLFGWIDALDRYALANHRHMTLPLLKSMLAENAPNCHET